jgi:DNA-binding MarR family transcriptional regulator
VVRRPNPDDRRSSLLALTDEGARLVDAAERTAAECLAELIGEALGGSPATARTFAGLRAALERDRVGTPTG